MKQNTIVILITILAVLSVLAGIVTYVIMQDVERSVAVPDERPIDIFPVIPDDELESTSSPIIVAPPAQNSARLKETAVAEMVFGRVKNIRWQCLDYDCLTFATSTGNWDMEYQHQFKTFLIGITGYPGLQYQIEAESVLRALLEMTDEELCSLGIKIFWDNWETNFDSEPRDLTFCTDSL